MNELPNEATQLLTPTRTYRSMVLVATAGALLLGLLGWAAVRGEASGRNPSSLGYELMANTQGTVRQVLVNEGARVQAGETLVLLDDDVEQKELVAARQDLDRLAQELQASGIAVALPPGTGIGGRIVTVGPMPKGDAPATGQTHLGALPPITGTPGPNSAPAAKPDSAASAKDVLTEIETKLVEAKAEVVQLHQKHTDSVAEAEEAARNAAAAKVIADQRRQQAEKMRMLLREGAVSQVETSRAEAQYASAQGGYEASVKQADEARATAETALAEAGKAEAKVTQLEKERQAAVELVAKLEALDRAPASAPAAAPAIDRPMPSKPAFVKASPAPNVPAKVEIDSGAKRDADAKLADAKKRVDDAEAAVLARKIVAPRAGKIVKILVKVGDTIEQGKSVVVIQFAEPAKG